MVDSLVEIYFDPLERKLEALFLSKIIEAFYNTDRFLNFIMFTF